MAEKKEVKKPKGKVFYSHNIRQVATFPILDKNGVQMCEKNNRGEDKYLAGEPVLVDRTVRFQCLSDDHSKGTLSMYVTGNPPKGVSVELELEVLKALAGNTSDVMTEAAHLKSVNKDAFDAKTQLAASQKENEGLKGTIGNMQEQLKAQGEKLAKLLKDKK